MKNTIGSTVCVTLFGESHGNAVGAVLDGLASGIRVEEEFIASQLTLRRPAGAISTARSEKDEFSILSGVCNGYTTGSPICIAIPNSDVRSMDYRSIGALARPSHADYPAFVKYGGFEDRRGGGHFSGRITAALVAAGAIAISALRNKGIYIGTHISRCAGISDRGFNNLTEDINMLNNMPFAVLDNTSAEEMKKSILSAAADNDSVGGVLETAVIGFPAGIGEPWFDTLEGVLSKILFSVPAVKGVEFGKGFSIADMKGSEANDPLYMSDGGKVLTETNNNGGINGGISNGMPIIFRCAIKPTPTISKPQHTVDMLKSENAELTATGRHDPCIAHRARVVIDSVTALSLCDMLTLTYGTDWLRG